MPDPDEPGISENERERRIFSQNLRAMGLDRKLVRKLVVGSRSKTGDMLRRKVAGRIQVVSFISTVDQLERAIKVLTKVVSSKQSTNDEKIAAAECLAQVATAKLRLGEAVIEHSDKCDPEAEELPPPPKDVPPPVAVNFNFPPVAASQRPAVEITTTPQPTDAKSG